VILNVAEHLSRLLRRRDPLAGRVRLSAPRFLGCGIAGVARSLVRR
jgi:hypothetical protein